MKKKLSLLAIGILLGIGGFFVFKPSPLTPLPQGEGNRTLVTPSGERISVRVADTPVLRSQGLSGTPLLHDDEGMLFLFDAPAKHSFWMKGMSYPIDIIWMKKEETGRFQIVHVAENVLPETYPQTFSPDVDSDAALEISAFGAERLGLRKGVDILVHN